MNVACVLCQRGWIPFREKCYFFSRTFYKLWEEGQQFCQETGADLALVDDQQEQVNFYNQQYGLTLSNVITEKKEILVQ